MAVFDNTAPGWTETLSLFGARLAALCAVVIILAGPVLIGGWLGHVWTDRLDDPVELTLQEHLPPTPAMLPTATMSDGTRAGQ